MTNSKFKTQNSKLRVAFDARMVHYRLTGGIGQYSVSLLRAMSRSTRMGPDSRVLMLQMRGDAEPVVRDKRFNRVPMWTPPHNRFEQPALGVELLKLRPRPQLIHCPDFVAPRYRLFPAVVNVQDLAFLKFPDQTLLTGESKRYYDQVHRAAQDADAIIALSQSAREDIISLLGVSPDKVVVIHAAAGDEFMPPDNLEEAQKTAAMEFGLPSPEEGGYILFVSTIEPRKNLPILLEAYRILVDRKQASPMPMLAIVGQEGWLYEKVYARIEELGLRDRVRLLGGLPGDKLVRVYQGARAFALPSLYEGFGLPALEALACGVPAISSNAGSLPEVVGDAGILLDPQDAQAWAEALERVLADKAEEARFRQAGPERASDFSWSKAADETWDLYEDVARKT